MTISVIVMFSHALSADEHREFLREMDRIFETPKDDGTSVQLGKKSNGYKVTAVFEIINGMAVTFPASKMQEVLKIDVVASVQPDRIIRIDPIKKQGM